MSTRNVLQTVVFVVVFAVSLATTQAAMTWNARTDFSTTSNVVTDTWQYLAVAEGANTGYSLLGICGSNPNTGYQGLGWYDDAGAYAPYVGWPESSLSSLYLIPGVGQGAVIGWKSPIAGTATVDYAFSIDGVSAQGSRSYALFKTDDVTALQSGTLIGQTNTGTITGSVSIANGQMLYLQLGPNGSGGTDFWSDDSRVAFSVSNVPEPASLLVLGLGGIGLFGATGRRRK